MNTELNNKIIFVGHKTGLEIFLDNVNKATQKNVIFVPGFDDETVISDVEIYNKIEKAAKLNRVKKIFIEDNYPHYEFLSIFLNASFNLKVSQGVPNNYNENYKSKREQEDDSKTAEAREKVRKSKQSRLSKYLARQAKKLAKKSTETGTNLALA